MNSERERERRQLTLASEVLKGYRDQGPKLDAVIADLDALWSEFRLQSDEWLNVYRGHWWSLEQVYAVVLDRELDRIPEDHRVLVDEAIDQLGFLVDDAVRRLTPEEDKP